MGQLTQTTAQVQVILDDADAANVGKASLTDSTDTTAVAVRKSGFYSLGASSSNAPSTDRAILISAVRDTTATGEIRYGQVAITESNGMWWNRDDGGTLGTWYEAVSTAGTQTLTNKTLTSPVLTTPQINDTSADHQYVFAVSELAADRTVTMPLLTGNDTFVFEAHTQTLTNKTLTTPTVSGLTLSDASIIFEGATANDHETTLTVTDPTADRTITLPDATDTLVGRATTDTLTNKTLTSPVFNTGVTGTAILDADDFTGASATTLATSESIKAYVDSRVGSFDTLAEVLAQGNTTGSTNIVVTAGQSITTDTIAETTSAAGVTVDSLLIKDGGITAAGTSTFAGQTISDLGTVTTANIDGGSIDGTTIGASTAAAGTFTTGDFSGQVQFNGTAGIQLDDGAQAHTWTLDDNFTSRLNIGTSSTSAVWKIGSNNNAYLTVSPSGIDVTGTVTADGLTVDGAATISVSDNSDNLSLISTDADDNSGPNLRMYRNSASPDDADVIGQIDFEGRNDNSQDVRYGFISAKISDASDGSEDGQLRFFTIAGGTETQTLTMESGNVGIGQTPGVRLHVEGATNSNVMIVNNIGTAPNYIFDVRDDGVSKFRVAPSGNVGIGTDSPNTAVSLEVAGAIPAQFTSTSTVATPMYGGVVAQRDTNTVGNGTGIGFALTDAGDNDTEYAYVGGLIESSTAGSEDGSLILATTLNNTRIERMRVTSAGHIQFPIATNAMGLFSDNISEVGSGNFALQIQNTAQTALKPFGIRAEDIRFATGSNERMKIDSDGVAHFNGDVKVLSGDVIMGSGRGINFTANSNASGMTSETLDDYEEGTWTPTVSSGTVTTGTSRYTKVGRLVTCYTQLTSFSDTTSTATVTIGGLPVAAEANDRATTLGVLAQHIANIGSITGGYLASTSTLLLYNTSSSGFTNLQHEDLDGSSSIYISFSYFAT